MEFYLYSENQFTKEQFEKAKQFLSQRLFILQKSAFNSDFYILKNTSPENKDYTDLEIMKTKIQVDFPVSKQEFETLKKSGYEKIFFQETFTGLIKIFQPYEWNTSYPNKPEFVLAYKELFTIPQKPIK